MDVIRIHDLLNAERTVFQKAVRQALDQSIGRRNEYRKQIAETLIPNSEEISENDFSDVLDILVKLTDGLSEILRKAGFNEETSADWLSKKSVPMKSIRKPLLQIIVAAALDSYSESSALYDLHHFLVEWGFHHREANANALADITLERKFEELDIGNELSVRVLNCIRNNNLVTLGEVLACTEREWLRMPNFGHASLKELNETLIRCVGRGIDSLSPVEKERFAGMANSRLFLESAAGQLLLTQWDTWDLKPEYKNLSSQARAEKLKPGESEYVQVTADPDLIEALKQQGIVHKTQLATAPQNVLDEVCNGRDDWRTMLLGILNGRQSSWNLELLTKVPLYLSDKVAVYRPKT